MAYEYKGKYTIDDKEYELKTISDYIKELKKAFFLLEENKGLTEDEKHIKYAKENLYPCRWFISIDEWYDKNKNK